MKTLMLLLLFITAGCSSADVYDVLPDLQAEETLHAILLLDDQEDERNHAYLDALLELEKSKPIDVHVVEGTEAASAAPHLQAEELPSLILYENGEVRMHMEEESDYEDVLQEIRAEVSRFVVDRSSESF
ncbi:hypothetical protein [Alkalicoccus chagannorensis]|uniref:hypothetical protein n=1 Tax=Alkalicoccus chagannorensis TaxID=427072 RepID=UPI000478DFFF|nr:hypothetical protein [Alkalicoccus chagannorensis]